MSEISLILVLHKKTNKTLNDMAKIQIKSEKLTPFGGFFSIMEQFDALLAQTIDSTLGFRCTMFGYQYSEILRSLMCCLRRFCYARNMYNKMNFCRFTSKIPRNPIGCGFEGKTNCSIYISCLS